MEILKSSLVSNFKDHKRLDITTHRGPLLTSTARITFAAAPAANDVIFLAPIAYTACIKEIILQLTTAFTAKMTANIGIYGMLPNGVFQTIKSDALGSFDTDTLAAKANLLVIDGKYWDKTIYQLLCQPEVVNGKLVYFPSEAFEPFKDSKYGILGLAITAPGTGIVKNTVMSARIDYVESVSTSQVVEE